MVSPSRRRATKRRRSSMTELAFHGIHTSRLQKAKSVTHVSGTNCHLCLGPLSSGLYANPQQRQRFAAATPPHCRYLALPLISKINCYADITVFGLGDLVR